tara:strand:- start:878 stop:1213 length:336 start_codon:yes stop_codon:yes gene_type:complete
MPIDKPWADLVVLIGTVQRAVGMKSTASLAFAECAGWRVTRIGFVDAKSDRVACEFDVTAKGVVLGVTVKHAVWRGSYFYKMPGVGEGYGHWTVGLDSRPGEPGVYCRVGW